MKSTSSPSLGDRMRAGLGTIGRTVVNIHRVPFYVVLAVLMAFVIECLSRRSLIDAAVFVWERPLAFLTNFGIILLTILPALLFRKRVAGLALLAAIWSVLGIAQCIVLLSRVSPLTAEDVAIVLSVISIITSYLKIWQIVLIVALLAGIIAALILLFVRARRHPICWKRFLIAYPASILMTVLVIAGGFTTGQLSDRFPNLAAAYNDYGFPYCFSMSVVDKGVDRPNDYGQGLMTDILGDLPGEGQEPPTADGDNGPNVIVVQLESFFDVKYLQGVTYSADPIPTFTALKTQHPSGLLNVPVIGAGTVNTEFEVLTGMNTADFGAGEYPFRSIMLETTCETLAYDLLASGYRTHAIHNHDGSFYLRNEVYPHLGFEDFTSIEYFKNPTFNETGWAHDALLTDEILHLLDSTQESDFVFAVSVQGHGKYPDEYTPAAGDVYVTGGIEDEIVRSHYDYFINQLSEMDAFIAALYNAVMAREENTVLVLYGDHLPSIARDEGISLSITEFQTEYLIITNYEAPGPFPDGELSTYQLFPAILELIGNDEGVMNRFHRVYRDDPTYLEHLSALSYDVLYGDRVAYNGKVYPTMTNMVMGSRPISLRGYETDGDGFLIRGENFTAYSVVVFDGWTQKTEFVDSTTLRVRDTDPERTLEKLKEITVRQVSDMNEVLSQTKPYRVSRASGRG